MDFNNLSNYFSDTYQLARQRFLNTSAQKEALLYELKLDATGPNGEDLIIDIAWLGSRKPQNALIHVSGIHGVEGFAGSAIQIKALEELQLVEDNNAIIFVHVFNPYGMVTSI